MDLLRKALREVEARVKPFTAASTSRSDPNDLAGTRLIVAGRTFRVGAMFAEGGAARVYRCASVSDGPGKRDDGRDGTVDAAEYDSENVLRAVKAESAPLALKQCLLPPELSDEEARREGVVHASVSAHDDVVTLHAHDVLVPPETRGEEKRNARGESARGLARAALLVMDLCEESLAERARRLGGLGEADALRACACAARAVAHMHARDPPVAHFDVKPENVLSSPPAEKKKRRRGVRAVDVASVRLRERPRRRRPRVFDAAGPLPRGVAVRANHHAHLPRAGDVGRAPSNLRGARGWAPGGRLGARVSAVPASGGPAPLRRGR